MYSWLDSYLCAGKAGLYNPSAQRIRAAALLQETFLDDGYMDMCTLIRAFFQADYDGTMI
jgi:hypothetical protein